MLPDESMVQKWRIKAILSIPLPIDKHDFWFFLSIVGQKTYNWYIGKIWGCLKNGQIEGLFESWEKSDGFLRRFSDPMQRPPGRNWRGAGDGWTLVYNDTLSETNIYKIQWYSTVRRASVAMVAVLFECFPWVPGASWDAGKSISIKFKCSECCGSI